MTTTKDLKAPQKINTFIEFFSLSKLLALGAIIVPLLVFYLSRKEIMLSLEYTPSITYISTSGLHGLGEVAVTLDGEPIDELSVIIVNLKNTGNTTISSIHESGAYNMAFPLAIEISSQAFSSQSKILSIQTHKDAEFRCEGKIVSSNQIEIYFSHLNPNEAIGFNILLANYNRPQLKLTNSPLINGIVDVLIVDPATKKSWHVILKDMLIILLGIIFISTAIFVFILIMINAFKLKSFKKSEDEWNSIYKDRFSELVTKNTTQKKEFIESKLRDIFDDALIQKIKIAKVEIPMLYDKKKKTTKTIYDICIDKMLEYWEDAPLPSMDPEFLQLSRQHQSIRAKEPIVLDEWNEHVIVFLIIVLPLVTIGALLLFL